jgi:hypothetical protein
MKHLSKKEKIKIPRNGKAKKLYHFFYYIIPCFGIENWFGGNFAQTITKKQKIKFFFLKTTPHSNSITEHNTQKVLLTFYQAHTVKVLLPPSNARPANVRAGRNFAYLWGSTILSAAHGHFEQPLFIPQCPPLTHTLIGQCVVSTN